MSEWKDRYKVEGEPGVTGRFGDATTLEVVGARDMLGRLRPLSEAGRARAVRVHIYRGDEAALWDAEVARLRTLDLWHQDHPEVQRPIDDALRELPALERPLRRLHLGEALRDAELFEVKRFLYHALAILEAAAGADGLPATGEPGCEVLRETMGAMHPESQPSARFHLSDQLDGELAGARKAHRRAGRELRKVRDVAEAQICERWGGRFDVRGRYRPEAGVNLDDQRLAYQGGAWQLVDEAVVEAEADLVRAGEAVDVCEQRLRIRLSDLLRHVLPLLEGTLDALARFDEGLARVRLREAIGGCWPERAERTALHLVQGRDPRQVERIGDEVQPIDVSLDAVVTVVLGPNMGGKSALLKLVGLSQFCAQAALPVPAERCTFGMMEALIYVGSEEGGAAEEEGLSSFGREVRRLVAHWEGAGPRLWLLDEPGRGTHPAEGARFARAVIEARERAGDRVVAATHFPEIAAADHVARLRIRGLQVSDEALRLALAAEDAPQERDVERLTSALRALMDYRPEPSLATDVPRDAWRVARALGLDLSDER
ncbi:hypothetical protein EA187_06625 [Lujinxingia sediminis]|uniref:DNA mismatch repair proteins mutS family domain-containing protein n=1 Tax=Lujinxingia sediminis TaxID=2480984 RepID=A0ABY0CW08_9DELT|nr:hypothetical protein [Lujinxingia sediminis]RVU46804.1 hypothetical protein EA187_06625 [Lujinxingia sediminis]